MGRKYARIFVLGQDLFLEARSFRRATLSENFSLLRTDNLPGEISIACGSKRFRGVWEQRKTEERDFRYFACAKNGARAKTEPHRNACLFSRQIETIVYITPTRLRRYLPSDCFRRRET